MQDNFVTQVNFDFTMKTYSIYYGLTRFPINTPLEKKKKKIEAVVTNSQSNIIDIQ